MKGTRIRLKLESFDHELLEFSCKKVLDAMTIKTHDSLKKLGNSAKIISLPTRRRIYCVLRSPHVNKKSREHFQICVHKKIVEVHCQQLEGFVFDILAKVELPSGVLCRILKV